MLSVCELDMKKFTIIELLIILAVIAILVTLLISSLSQARESAKKAVCFSNLKQIANAVEMYKKSYNLRLPKSVEAIGTNWTDIGNHHEWKILLNEFLNQESDSNDELNQGVFACPSNDKNKIKRGGYGWNVSYLKYEPIDNSLSETQYYFGYKFLSITNPDETLLIGDTADSGWDINVCRSPDGILSRVGNRHTGKLNILWADSHISSESPIKMINGKEGKQNYYYLADKENQD